MVTGCKNYSQRNDRSTSFHRIPTNNKIKEQWLKRIPDVNPRSPAYSYVCSVHFISDCFNVSCMTELTGQKQQLRLHKGSILSIFLSSSSRRFHTQSKTRKAQQEHQEVSEINLLHMLLLVITSKM